MSEDVVIVGAGAVGVACALALRDAGRRVTLIDARQPGSCASRWNAGVLATSSLVPLNGPGLFAKLPALVSGRTAGFRFNRRAGLRGAGWGVRFLAASRSQVFAETIAALNGLIRLSMSEHVRLLRLAGAEALLRRDGWLLLFETEAAFAGSAGLRAVFERHSVAYEVLGSEDVARMEPDLVPRFVRAILMTDTVSAIEPGLVIDAYVDLFRSRGGRVERMAVRSVDRSELRPALLLDNGARRAADWIIVAAGPWTAELLATMDITLPMMSERGYVRRFLLRDGAVLRRPIYDVAGALVMSPRPEGVQLSTGTELTRVDLPGLDLQREPAAQRAAKLLPLGAALRGFDAAADRPTLPDSRPVIGPLRDAPGVWICAGHQHIGFSTSSGSAALLAALMVGAAPPLDPRPFAPARFGL